jgi:hypothetical protein
VASVFAHHQIRQREGEGKGEGEGREGEERGGEREVLGGVE